MTDEKNIQDAASETEEVETISEMTLTDAELQVLCKERVCPACPTGVEAEDIRLRSLADLDNARKRLEKEKDDFRKYAAEKVLGDLLPALDNLDLALMHIPEEDACKNFVMGVEMTRKALLDVLNTNGLVGVGEVGEAFSPETHEAVAQDEREDMDEGLVSKIIQRGYFLNGRLLRPAKVMVSRKPE